MIFIIIKEQYSFCLIFTCHFSLERNKMKITMGGLHIRERAVIQTPIKEFDLTNSKFLLITTIKQLFLLICYFLSSIQN